MVPLLRMKLSKVRHLLEIGRNIRIVAPQMHVVEHDMDNTLDIAAGRLQLTRRIRGNRCADSKSNTKRQGAAAPKKFRNRIHRSLL